GDEAETLAARDNATLDRTVPYQCKPSMKKVSKCYLRSTSTLFYSLRMRWCRSGSMMTLGKPSQPIGGKKIPFTCLTAKKNLIFRLGTAYLWCFIFFYIR